MNKLEVMRQPSMWTLQEELVKHTPGITTDKLFDKCKEWHGKLWHHSMTADFERGLWDLREKGYRVTNKQWYPAGHVAEPSRHGGKKEDPRQTRMFG